MNELKIRMKKTSELGESEMNSIIALKQQYWKYDDSEQRIWFEKNIRSEDNHLMIYRGGVLLAYLNAVNVEAGIDQFQHRMLGIGNVCVDKNETHTGIGGILMMCVNAFIKKAKTPGILLCKEKLILFYKVYNWSEIRPANVIINDTPYDHKIMVYDPGKQLPTLPMALCLDRSF